MNNEKMTVYELVPELNQFYKNSNLAKFIKQSIDELGNEEVRFSGDELASLGEDTIYFLSGIIISTYLQVGASNNEINNDLLRIFFGKNTSGGFLLYLSKNITDELFMLEKKNKIKISNESKYFLNIINNPDYSDIDNGKLSHALNFRNNLMHGTFLAPLEMVKTETYSLLKVLELIFSKSAPQLRVQSDEPYIDDFIISPLFIVDKTNSEAIVNLRDNWSLLTLNINLEEKDIQHQLEKLFTNADSFIKVYLEYLDEIRGSFLEKEFSQVAKLNLENSKKNIDDSKEIYLEMKEHNHFSLGIYCANKYPAEKVWAKTVMHFQSDKEYLVIPYQFKKEGIRYSIDAFLGAVLNIISKKTNKQPKNYSRLEIEKFILKQIKSIDKQIIVIINNYHLRHFHSEHLRKYIDFLANTNIKLLAFGIGYRELNRSFVKTKSIGKLENTLIKQEDINNSINAYLTDHTSAENLSKSLHVVIPILLDKLKENLYNSNLENDFLSLRRLHSIDESKLNEYPLYLLYQASSVMAGYLSFGKQQNWYELDEQKQLSKEKVIFHDDFSLFEDITKIDIDDKRYRMFGSSINIQRPETEIDLVYDILKRDTINIEHSSLAIKLNA